MIGKGRLRRARCVLRGQVFGIAAYTLKRIRLWPEALGLNRTSSGLRHLSE